MKFQAFHVNPGEKLKKKDVNNDLSNFMSVFPNAKPLFRESCFKEINVLVLSKYVFFCLGVWKV